MSILEIAHSSLNLLQILESKREFRLEAIKRAGMGEAGALKDGEEARVEENWLRGMSRFKLSDGFREWEAIEYEKVSGLGLGEIKLGAKVSQLRSSTFLRHSLTFITNSYYLIMSNLLKRYCF